MRMLVTVYIGIVQWPKFALTYLWSILRLYNRIVHRSRALSSHNCVCVFAVAVGVQRKRTTTRSASNFFILYIYIKKKNTHIYVYSSTVVDVVVVVVVVIIIVGFLFSFVFNLHFRFYITNSLFSFFRMLFFNVRFFSHFEVGVCVFMFVCVCMCIYAVCTQFISSDHSILVWLG